MADIFRKTLKDREDREEGLKPPPPVAAAPPAPAIDFFKQQPVDPAKEAARRAAKLRLLRDQ
jgi:hypothetical protein